MDGLIFNGFKFFGAGAGELPSLNEHGHKEFSTFAEMETWLKELTTAKIIGPRREPEIKYLGKVDLNTFGEELTAAEKGKAIIMLFPYPASKEEYEQKVIPRIRRSQALVIVGFYSPSKPDMKPCVSW